VIHHQAERVRKAVEEAFEGIRFHTQDAKNFPGTGGAMMGIKPAHEKTLILNGDMPLVTAEALTPLVQTDADIVMSVIALDDPHGYGRVIINDGRVECIVEQKDCNAEQLEVCDVNAGVYCVKTALLERYIPRLSNDNAQNEYYLTDIVAMAVSEDKIVKPVWVEEALFKGVNSKKDLAQAEVLMQRRIREHWMAQGVTMQLPETIYIDADATFEGECILENGVRIEGVCRIVRSHIKAHSVIEKSVLIDSDAGPMAHIRPDSYLEATHIGNFVEVKKSTLKGVKAGHLAYLGDASVDEGTNIGAGVITCNYDGKAKHKTVIGKNVFVGSDTQLVAPVTIEDNVLIGAGTTVTKNIDEGSLAISRAPLKTVKNFFYKFFGVES
jgi:bifunctional UDP-N-acetylglucosamine pyrophosphorylase/glucosamine-1-phosphate N-acetyltransferase